MVAKEPMRVCRVTEGMTSNAGVLVVENDRRGERVTIGSTVQRLSNSTGLRTSCNVATRVEPSRVRIPRP